MSNNNITKLEVTEDLKEVSSEERIFSPDLEHERELTFYQSLVKYRKAVIWSVLISHTTIMEAYDVSLIGSLIAFPAFKEKFGVLSSSGSYSIPAPWQSGVTQAAGCGEVLGLALSAWSADRFGYRFTLIAALLIFGCFVFIVFFAPNLTVLIVGEVLCGLPWGAFQTLTITYAADITPASLRGYLTTYVNICWSLGKFLSAGVLRALLNRKNDPSSYRIAFAIQWIWPIPLAIIIYFSPESPVWLLKKGRIEEAKKSVKRLTSTEEEFKSMYANSYYTNALEVKYSTASKYFEMFKGVNRKRTFLVIFAWVVQALCGSALTAQAAFFFQSAGLSTEYSFDLNMVNNVVGLVGTIILWSTMKYFGRRLNMLTGLIFHCMILLTMGCLGLKSTTDNSSYAWALGGLTLLLELIYSISLGPLAYSASGELPTARLRAKTASLGRNIYQICTIGRGVLNTYMLSTTAWNWGGKAGFFWLGFCVVFLVMAYFIFPETNERTAAEIDYLFEHKIPLRNFKSAKVAAEVENEMITADQEKNLG